MFWDFYKAFDSLEHHCLNLSAFLVLDLLLSTWWECFIWH